jgi:hypothetical protein
MIPFAMLAALQLGAAPSASPEPGVSMRVDSSRHEVVIRAGPFDLPNMPPMENEMMMDMSASHDTPVQHFTWPVEGWFRGFKLAVTDGEGRPVPRRIMHHLIVINYSRRQLVYHAAERLFGAGTETEDASLPSTIGIPITPGSDIGFYVAWHNDTGEDLKGVQLTMTLQYLPRNQNPRPVDVLPLYMDVNLTVGEGNEFDVPPGKSQKSFEFDMPISGRLIGFGGHLHDYGVKVTLEDVTNRPREIAQVEATRDPQGHVVKVERKLPGVRGAGIKLSAGHRYRVTGYYDNPTDKLLKDGAMAHMSGIFAPDDYAQWPAIDQSDPTFQQDLVSLEMRGMHAMEDMDHDHTAHDSEAPQRRN